MFCVHKRNGMLWLCIWSISGRGVHFPGRQKRHFVALSLVVVLLRTWAWWWETGAGNANGLIIHRESSLFFNVFLGQEQQRNTVDGRPINRSFNTDLLLKQTHLYIFYIIPSCFREVVPLTRLLVVQFGSTNLSVLYNDSTLQYANLFAYLECLLARSHNLCYSALQFNNAEYIYYK